MALTLRKITKRLIIGANLVFATPLLLCSIIPYLKAKTPESWGFIALAFPILLLINLGFVLFWLVAKPRISLISLVFMLCCFHQFSALIAFGDNQKSVKHQSSFNLLSWNVHALHIHDQPYDKSNKSRNRFFEEIADINAEIVCLQEFASFSYHQDAGNAIDTLKAITGLKHHFFSRDYFRSSYYSIGCIILSKYPIIDTGRIVFPKDESVIYADLQIGDDTVRVITTHLQSYKFGAKDYKGIDKIKNYDDSLITASKGLIAKMATAFEIRKAQTKVVRKLIDTTHFSTIVCGDFNDVQNSATYWSIRGNLKDAFLEKGSGFGRTFNRIWPTLRIDFLLHDEKIKTQKFAVGNSILSDHYPLVAALAIDK
jgi:endonuclease/exonuclease/phosphatase family metal-dependent hydrolase